MLIPLLGQVARGHGIEAVVATIRRHPDKEGIQCNGCLALMSLVRGEGEVCQVQPPSLPPLCPSCRAIVGLKALLCLYRRPTSGA